MNTEYGIDMSGIALDGETMQVIPYDMVKDLQTILCYDYEDGEPNHDMTCVMELIFNNGFDSEVQDYDVENKSKKIRYLYDHPWNLLRDFSKLTEHVFNFDRIIAVRMDLTAGWFQHRNKDLGICKEDFDEFHCTIKHKKHFHPENPDMPLD